tara:strand:+ start:3266 stop:3517 length:252 start_codon:yes stop_codon:yes gene_type:complete
MKKGDVVKRIHITKDYHFDDLLIGESGVIVKGPYEKNITDVHCSEGMLRYYPKIVEIKRVIDILFEEKICRYRIASDYERARI